MRKFILTTLLALSFSVDAGGYVGNGKISVMQSAFGGWILKTQGANENPDNCSSSHVILQPSHSQYDELYSFLLAAYAAGKPVNISVNGCHNNGYKKLSFVYSKWN